MPGQSLDFSRRLPSLSLAERRYRKVSSCSGLNSSLQNGLSKKPSADGEDCRSRRDSRPPPLTLESPGVFFSIPSLLLLVLSVGAERHSLPQTFYAKSFRTAFLTSWTGRPLIGISRDQELHRVLSLFRRKPLTPKPPRFPLSKVSSASPYGKVSSHPEF